MKQLWSDEDINRALNYKVEHGGLRHATATPLIRNIRDEYEAELATLRQQNEALAAQLAEWEIVQEDVLQCQHTDGNCMTINCDRLELYEYEAPTKPIVFVLPPGYAMFKRAMNDNRQQAGEVSE